MIHEHSPWISHPFSEGGFSSSQTVKWPCYTHDTSHPSVLDIAPAIIPAIIPARFSRAEAAGRPEIPMFLVEYTIKIHPYPSNFILIPHQNPHLWMVQNPLLPQLKRVSGLLLQPLHHGILRRILPDVSMDGLLKGISSKMCIYILMDDHPKKWYINYNGWL